MESKVDLMLVGGYGTEAEVLGGIRGAVGRGLRGVYVGGAWVKQAAGELEGRGIRPGVVVGWPLGLGKSTVKAIEATAAIKDGAGEVEVVALGAWVMERDWGAVRAELMEIVRGARAVRRDVGVNVVIEMGLVLQRGGEGMLAEVCAAIVQSGCDGVVSGSGYVRGEKMTAELVGILKRCAGGLMVKVGGVRDWELAREMIEAGADRVGLEEQ